MQDNGTMKRVSFHVRGDQILKMDRYKLKMYGDPSMVDNAKIFRQALDEFFEKNKIR